MANPLVSVVMTTRDRAHLLPRAISSVMAQTLSDWELLVVDDGSVDRTPEAVGAFRDARIRYIGNDVSLGLPAARNVGLAAARGRWIGFLDDDDEYMPSKLQIQVGRMQGANQTTSATYSGICLAGKVRTYQPRLREAVEADLLEGRDIGSVAPLLVDREVAAALRFDPDLVAAEDRDFRLRLASVSDLDAVEDVLYIAHTPPGPRLTADAKRAFAGLEAFAVKHATRIAATSELEGEWEFLMFRRAVGAREFDSARRHLERAWMIGRRGPSMSFYRTLAAVGDFPLHTGYAVHSRTRTQVRRLLEVGIPRRSLSPARCGQ